MWQYREVTVRQCPRCELRFLYESELKWHLEHDHPAPRGGDQEAPELPADSGSPPSLSASRAEIFDEAERQTLAYATLQVHASVAATDAKVDKKEDAAFMKMMEAPNRGSLVAELTSSILDRMTEIRLGFDQNTRSGDQRLLDASTILSDKTTAGLLTQEEAGLVKSYLVDLAFAVAKASRGGFRIDKISDEEAKAILAVADLIDYHDEDPQLGQALSDLRSRSAKPL
jgi:hypothetical protein